jgi:D-aminopeptidase
MLGLGKTGGIASNGSGDYVIAVSTAENNRIPYDSDSRIYSVDVLRNDALSPLFMAVIEATEEAVINSLFAAESMTGHDGHVIEALPVDEVMSLMKKHSALKK